MGALEPGFYSARKVGECGVFPHLAHASWLSPESVQIPSGPATTTKDGAHERCWCAAGENISWNHWNGRYGEDVCPQDC